MEKRSAAVNWTRHFHLAAGIGNKYDGSGLTFSFFLYLTKTTLSLYFG